MWTCPCGEQIEDQFDECWRCANPDGVRVPLAIKCPHCKAALKYHGRKRFHTDAVLFDYREKYDVYVCSRCGHLEFFLAKIGEELRRDDNAEDYSAPD